MSWVKGLRELRQQLRVEIANAITRTFLWTTTANSTELGKEDAVRLADDDSGQKQRSARRVEPFGFRSRPVAKQRCLSLRLGSSTVIYLGVASDGGYGPGDLEDGETAIYSKNVEKALHAREDGVTAINGDDFSAPKTETLLTSLAGLSQALATVLSAATDTGLAGALAAAPAPPINDPSGVPYLTNSAAIAGLLASATPYKSTKVKNG